MKPVGSKNLKDSSTLGRLGFEGLFFIHVLQLYLLVDRFRLRGLHRGFLSSTSVSSSITCFDVILYLHLSSLLLNFTFIVCCISLCLRVVFQFYWVSFTLVPQLVKLE